MRQKLKYAIFTIWYLLIPFSILESILYSHRESPIFMFFIIIPIAIIVVSIHPLRRSGYGFIANSPKLGKKVVHDSGTYYITYSKKLRSYSLYKDLIFYKREIFEIDDDYIESTEGISKYVKEKLDKLYQKELEIKKKISLLSNWDGYASKQAMRDDKISKII